MPCLVGRSFQRLSGTEIEHLLFVGITRAVRWAYLSAVKGGALAELDRIHRLVDEASLTLREDSAFGGERSLPGTRAQAAESQPTPSGIDDLF
jgi:hypothetical protein